jgi:hypothetical protein
MDNNQKEDLLNKLQIGADEYNRVIGKSGRSLDDNYTMSLFILNQIYDVYNNYKKGNNEKEQYLTESESAINESYSGIVDNIRSPPSKLSEADEEWMRGMGLGGKPKAKSKKNNVSKKPVVSQNKQSEYKEILGKKMKIYKIPDSRKQYVRYKGELHSISDYKNLMKQKAAAKAKTTAKAKK